MIVLHETAPGKLNLTLDVLGQRPDGYHDLEMVMVSVSLCDSLTLELGTGEPWSVTCDRSEIPDGPENLCWKAARAYCDAAGVDPDGLRIRVKKHIPAQAGMAGGSSDAAAVLRALNRHYGRFSDEELRALGLRVGSDVPYCLFGGVALARGRGELLTRLPDLPKELYFVLIKPEFSASTPALFRALDTAGVTARPDTAAMLSAIQQQDRNAIGANLQNAFEPLVAAQYPQVKALRQILLAHGAIGARLTGTGSVIFGLFCSKLRAFSAALELEELCPQVHLAEALPAPPCVHPL
ncbi:MAG: 4-(cytidine 5'-diphospho)-2-C-methyl-D-erythritol kinase [Oscillospiraceae bacterium]|nr:4-(cytidine 5'-diphospho)-2-C-methyl-D-erythritol kinase [Oscillospiraceae bacterium]